MAEMLAVLLRQSLLLSVAVALLWSLRPLLLRRLGAGATYAAWILVPALLLTPVLPRPAQEPLRLALQATRGDQPAALPSLPMPPTRHLPLWLTLWLAGSAAVLGVQARRQWLVGRHGARLPAGSSPALVGLLRPCIALPEDFEQRFAPAERELILAHEQVHLRRLDNLWNLLACMLTALHWWNPLVWWAQRRFQADQELACDSAVLAARPDATTIYTRALLAAHDLTAHGAPLSSRWGSSHPLVERIAMLKHPTQLTRRQAAVIALAMAGTASLAYAAQATPTTDTANGPFIRLTLAFVLQEGVQVRRTSVSLIGKSGKSMRVVIGPNEELGLSLTPTALDDRMFQLDLRFNGLPADLDVGRPRLKALWGDAATFESVDPKTANRLSVFVVGTRVPAPPQMPKPQT